MSAFALPALAQTAPDAGALLQQQQGLEARPSLPIESAPLLKETAPAKPARAGEVTVHVKAFRITGNLKTFSQAELLALLQPWVGRELNVAQLQEAAQAITAHYRAKGYFLAYAYLIKQDVSDGIITLEIREGQLDSSHGNGIRVQGDKLRLKPEQAEAIVNKALAQESTLRLKYLERGILLLNDLPGVNATANLEPGQAAGTTRIAVDVNEGPLATGSLTADNYGNRYVGSQRVTGNAALNDLSGRGDQFTASLTRTIDNDHYNYGAFGYSLPIGTDGWRVGLSVTDLAFGVGEELASQDSQGTSRTYGLNARYPLLRTRTQNIYAILAYDQRWLYNETAGSSTSNKRLDLASAGMMLDSTDDWAGGGIWQAGGTFTAGTVDLSRNQGSLEQDQSSSGPHTQGNYTKFDWNISRVQQAGSKLTLSMLLTGQTANSNLDSSEKFQLGGPTGIRAYPTGEGQGDSGMRASLEARESLGRAPRLGGDIGVSVFYDWGRIQQYHDASNLGLTGPNVYRLAGYGFGLSLSQVNRYDLRLIWAQKLGSNPNQANGKDSDGSNHNSRVWLAFNMFLR